MSFKILSTRFIDQLEMKVILMKHEKLKTPVLHIEKDDKNSVFGIALQTPPQSSNGVPHILEHISLCGSKKYPVRDPFFKMMNRSLATYMNAWTAAEFTMYPFSTQVKADMNNLRSVYLDAVFNPLLTRNDFLQEGWRLEYKNTNDKSSPLVLNGIVYNEMKGAMADPSSLFCSAISREFFPGTPYIHNSGGDPKVIPDLTYEELKSFHSSYYHPSNAMIYSYGSYPLNEHLDYMNDFFADFKPADPLKINYNHEPFITPKYIESTCPPDPMGDINKQVKYAITYLTNPVKHTYDTFVMNILSSLLLNGPSSPFHQSLVESNLGSEYAASTGYDSSTHTTSFSVGLQGLYEKDIPVVEQKIQKVFEQVIKEGIELSRVEATLHQMELRLKRKSANFGMGLSYGLMSAWIHGSDPLEYLDVQPRITKFQETLKQSQKGNSKYTHLFTPYIQKYFLNNPHKLTLIMRPDDLFAQKLADEEAKRIKRMVNNLDIDSKNKIFSDGILLKQDREKEQNLECLPSIKVQDLDRKPKLYPVVQKNILCGNNEYPVMWRKTPTNQISYVRSLITLNKPLPGHLITYLPLFSSALTNLGTNEMTAAELDETIRSHTGGISVSPSISSQKDNILGLQVGLLLSGHCLDRNIPKLYNLMGKIWSDTRWSDHEKLKTLILGSASGMMNSLAQNGHVFAKLHASATTPATRLHELQEGLSQVTFLNELSQLKDLTPIVDNLKELMSYFQKNSSVRFFITSTSDDEFHKNGMLDLTDALSIPAQSSLNFNSLNMTSTTVKNAVKTLIPVPFNTNHAAVCTNVGLSYSDKNSQYLSLLSSLTTTHYLHPRIREARGAYGGFSGYSEADGIYSNGIAYRDPDGIGAIAELQNGSDWIINEWLGHENQRLREMDEAKIRVFARLDAPVNVQNEGMGLFINGITDEMKTIRRETLLDAKSTDLRSVYENHLSKKTSCTTVIVGDQAREGFESQNSFLEAKQKEGWIIDRSFYSNTAPESKEPRRVAVV